ncbi:MAG: ribonuclease R [Burkholderiaceae bacterium]
MTQDWIVPTREKILKVLRDAGDPMRPDALASALDVSETNQRNILDKRLAAMERDGQLLPNRKGVLLLASKLDFIAGRVIGHRDGFGFVRRDEGGPDLFLPARQMQKVMHGDRVLVKQAGQDSRGRPEGAIVEVTERVNRHIVGRFLNERGVHLVVPEDQRIKHDILIPPSKINGAVHGQVVTCEVIDPPTRNTQPIGHVVEVLGDIGDSGMEIEIAVRKFDVPHVFDNATLAQADSLADEVQDADILGRVDLRDIALVTIDGADARDFDDAVYCEPIYGTGKRARQTGYRLLVAIADVSHYVRPGEPLDNSATARTTSVYFPRRVIPMLPEKLSNGLCSLNPLTDRLVLVCDMVVTLKGKVKAYQFYKAVMYSSARLTYDAVWSVLSGHSPSDRVARESECQLDGAQLEERLVSLNDLYRVFAQARNERGALEFETVETRIECDSAGRIERIVPTVRNDAHRIIEECMLAANVCAADFIQRKKHAGLYRVHEGPTQEKLAQLKSFLKTSGLSMTGGTDPSPKDYGALSRKIKGRPDSDLLQTMMLRSMQQAVYTPDNAGHFGLAYDAYTHFTSPIRRYPDLLVHRVIKACLDGKKYVPTNPAISSQPEFADAEFANAAAEAENGEPGTVNGSTADAFAVKQVWTALGVLCSTNERRADDASRDVEAWLKCQFMRDRVGEEYPGLITGVAPFGVFVTLDALHVEGMVHVSELGSEYFQFNEVGHALLGERTGMRFRLTDPIRVQVSRVDLEARRIEFRLAAGVGVGAASDRKTQGKPDSASRPQKSRKAASAPTDKVRKARAERLKARVKPGKAKPGKSNAGQSKTVKSKPAGKAKGNAKSKKSTSTRRAKR